MKNKEKLKRAERLEIAILLNKEYSFREIAKALNRSPNTISYEVNNNSTNGEYDPIKAHSKARVRKRMSKFQWMKIEENKELKQYIIIGLKKHWNPDEISGRMTKEKQPFYASKTAIYDWLRSNRGQYYCQYLYSKRYRKKKRKKNKTARVMIPERVSIDKRFLGANNRTRYGHWEKDAIVSRKGGKGSLAVGQVRKSRLVVAAKTKTMSPKEHLMATKKMTNGLLVLSLTFDNGIENKNHKELGRPTFFCDSYSSWQKPEVENANKMIRRYFPKGTDFQTVSQKEVNRVVSIINNKPRKILGYRTALEVARASGVLYDNNRLVS
jgi:IS30 family transposase